MHNFIAAVLLDLLLFGLNVTFAILQRGTFIGWFCTAFVVWQCYTFIKVIRSI